MGNNEYWTEEIFTKQNLSDTINATSRLLCATSLKDVDNVIEFIKSAGISYFLGKIPTVIGKPLAIIYALYTVGNNEYMSQSVDVIKNGLSNLQKIYNTVKAGNYSAAKIRLAVCDVRGEARIIEGAELVALKPTGSSGWISLK